MKKQICLSIVCLTFCALMIGCEDDVYERGSVQCNATYLINAKGKLCYFGDCGIYDTDLRDHFCPVDVPFCIEYKAKHYYCGTECPEGYVQTDYMCKKEDTECRDNEILCENVCIDPMSSTLYCGSDERCIPNECLSDQVCKHGQCQCPDSTMMCKDRCVNIQYDTEHCGSCDNNCTNLTGWSDGICLLGKCVAQSCIEGYHTAQREDDSIWCEPDSTEPCGNSGIVCPPHSTCIPELGDCVCNDGYSTCQAGCFDLTNDVDHCGSCDHACHVAHAQNVCTHGECAFKCHEGYIKSIDGTHCEPQSNPACQEGERRCNDHSYEICMNGDWVVLTICTDDSQCDPAYGCDSPCSGNFTFCPPNICSNIQVDNDNCGECGIRCNVAHAQNTCQEGKCIFTCEEGYVKTDDGTGCEPGNCTEGEQRCDHQTLQMCHHNQWIALACTAPENGTATCSNSSCSIVCNPGYTLCNEKCVDLQFDVNNCGACYHQCSTENSGIVCNHGMCTSYCSDDLLMCNSICVKATSKKGIVYSRARIYTNPENDYTDYAEKYTIYNLYGQLGYYYAIKENDEKFYISKDDVYILPATGLIDVAVGVNVRQGPGITFSVINVILEGNTVTIDDYQLGDPLNGEGWFHIRSPYDGYMSAYYVSLVSGSSAGTLPECQ